MAIQTPNNNLKKKKKKNLTIAANAAHFYRAKSVLQKLFHQSIATRIRTSFIHHCSQITQSLTDTCGQNPRTYLNTHRNILRNKARFITRMTQDWGNTGEHPARQSVMPSSNSTNSTEMEALLEAVIRILDDCPVSSISG